MVGRIGNLLGHSAVYMAANFLQRGLAFLLIPLYAAYFTTAEFGAMDMLYQMVMVLVLFASLGLPQGLVRGFYLNGNEELPAEERRKLLGALVTFLVPITLLTTALLLIFADPIARLLFQSEGKAHWVRLSAWLYLALVFQALPMQLYKTEQRSQAFALWSLATFALIAGGNLYFIMILKLGLPGMLLGNLLGVGGTAGVLFLLMLPKVKLNFEWRRLSPLFEFGIPMLPNLLSRKVLEVANRYMIPYWYGLSEVGIFSMGARVASIMDILLLMPFLFAWQPFLYSLAGKSDAPVIFARVTHYFLLLMLTIFLGLQVIQKPILHFLGHGKYDEAGPVVSLLVLAALFNGLQYCVSAGIHLKKKLVAEMGLIAAVAACNLMLNFLLIPPWGATGAAAATAISFFLFFVSSYVLSQRNYPVPYLYGRGGKALLVAAAAFGGLQAWESIYLKITIVFAFFLIGPIRDLFLHGELKQARVFVMSKLHGMKSENGTGLPPIK